MKRTTIRLVMVPIAVAGVLFGTSACCFDATCVTTDVAPVVDISL
jgi:hypothetical protein